ncbi:hypothetical protein ACFVHB_20145 [Kitasatospora sp. NPDC127111]|uniref:hypothetical protein n=1 Tax=Kitasatospora sp. NPDC127111 TaxID=3345363 RepID=UPI0036407472
MAVSIISPDAAPAIGDVRALGERDLIIVAAGSRDRRDWPRYMDAIGVAITRGAGVIHADGEPE